MKLLTPNIVYHNIEPIYTCDVQNVSTDYFRLATGGFDCAVRLWKLNCNSNAIKDDCPIELLATLNRHEKRVNIVRWSPSGNILASASDDGVIILWTKTDDSAPQKIDDDEINLETWVPKCLRRHFQDVYDLCWSSNEDHLISGSIDCCAILWNLKNVNKVIILKDHKHFVQGVAWDPLDNVVITQSSDRTMRVYRASSRQCIYKVWKSCDSKLFQDGSWKYFFRRLEFSPDGKLLVTPAGFYERKKNVEEVSDVYSSNNNNDTHAAHIFVRHNLSKVAVTIPTGKNAVIGVRFNPIRFSLKSKSTEAVFKLPFRWIFCLILDNGLLICDTEHCLPIVKIFDIHCLSITDASWSSDGHCLVVSSTDGYCSYIYFEKGELGDVFTLTGNQSIKAPLRTIENNIVSETTKSSIISNVNLSLPVLELDPTEILRATTKTEHIIIESDPETDNCTDDREDETSNDVIEIQAEDVPKVPGIIEIAKPIAVKRRTTVQVTNNNKNSLNEPDTKKRRITLTMLP